VETNANGNEVSLLHCHQEFLFDGNVEDILHLYLVRVECEEVVFIEKSIAYHESSKVMG